MAFARSICRIHWIAVVAVVVAIIAVSTWTLASLVIPRAESILDLVIDKYDAYVPEIAITGGEAFVEVEQPYFIDVGGPQNGVFVIDTGMEEAGAALEYLKDADNGMVLTKNALVIKNNRQYRILPLKDIPDFVVNGSTLRELKGRFFPLAVTIVTVCFALYYVVSKLVQVFLFALIPYLGASSQGATYGDGLKIAAFAMIPPVVLALIALFAGLGFWISFLTYFALYLVLLILATVGLARTGKSTFSPTAPINP